MWFLTSARVAFDDFVRAAHTGPGPDGVPPHRGRPPRGGPRADGTLQGSPRAGTGSRATRSLRAAHPLHPERLVVAATKACARPPRWRTTTRRRPRDSDLRLSLETALARLTERAADGAGAAVLRGPHRGRRPPHALGHRRRDGEVDDPRGAGPTARRSRRIWRSCWRWGHDRRTAEGRAGPDRRQGRPRCTCRRTLFARGRRATTPGAARWSLPLPVACIAAGRRPSSLPGRQLTTDAPVRRRRRRSRRACRTGSTHRRSAQSTGPSRSGALDEVGPLSAAYQASTSRSMTSWSSSRRRGSTRPDRPAEPSASRCIDEARAPAVAGRDACWPMSPQDLLSRDLAPRRPDDR